MTSAPIVNLVRSSLNRRAILPLMVGMFILTLGSPALAQERMIRTLTVTGQGTENVPTTKAELQLGVEVEATTATAAQQEAARRSTAVVNLLRSRNVERLQTSGITLNPRYNYNNNEQRLVGYTATNTVSFRIASDRAGALLDEVVDAGASRIDGIRFIAEDAAIAIAQRQALREATEEAQEQADAVLDALGLSRGDVVSIQINGATPPPPAPMLRMEAQLADTSSTPIIGSEQEVGASVTLQIQY